jgi:hypothetical protein
MSTSASKGSPEVPELNFMLKALPNLANKLVIVAGLFD